MGAEMPQCPAIRREEHWLYHPVLDGYGPPVADPLAAKAACLRDQGATILRDAVCEEAGGIVHRLEWLDGAR